jgi:tRNA-dihydrouridine synthase B
MAGVSEMPYRVLARSMGAAAAPTELVSAKGLIYGQSRTEHYLRKGPSEYPFWVQIFGGDPETMALAAERAVDLGADILDINMGCPVKKITRHGAGSGLLTDIKRAAAVVSAMVKRVKVPVTVKIRSGWDQDQITAIALTQALADAGAACVAIHARTRQQGYSGRADWSLIRELVASSPIPIVGNGDVDSPEKAHAMLSQTGCAAVMIGRGALGNPWIFERLTKNTMAPTSVEREQLLLRHFTAHLADCGDELRAIRRFRSHLVWYSHGLMGAASFLERIMDIDDLNIFREVIQEYFAAAKLVYPRDLSSFSTKGALG